MLGFRVSASTSSPQRSYDTPKGTAESAMAHALRLKRRSATCIIPYHFTLNPEPQTQSFETKAQKKIRKPCTPPDLNLKP